MSSKFTLAQVQEALDGMIEPTIKVSGKWLTFKATQSWAECGDSFKAIKAANKDGLKSLFYRGGTIGVLAEHVTIEKAAKTPRAKQTVYADSASVLASLLS